MHMGEYTFCKKYPKKNNWITIWFTSFLFSKPEIIFVHLISKPHTKIDKQPYFDLIMPYTTICPRCASVDVGTLASVHGAQYYYCKQCHHEAVVFPEVEVEKIEEVSKQLKPQEVEFNQAQWVMYNKVSLAVIVAIFLLLGIIGIIIEQYTAVLIGAGVIALIAVLTLMARTS